MITRSRMKIDVLGQSVLIVAILLLFFFASGLKWTYLTMSILFIWQIASAIHLFYSYKYVRKLNFIRTALILLISLPIWFKVVNFFSFIAVGGLVVWYFWATVRDMIYVYKRPRSFWDI